MMITLDKFTQMNNNNLSNVIGGKKHGFNINFGFKFNLHFGW